MSKNNGRKSDQEEPSPVILADYGFGRTLLWVWTNQTPTLNRPYPVSGFVFLEQAARDGQLQHGVEVHSVYELGQLVARSR